MCGRDRYATDRRRWYAAAEEDNSLASAPDAEHIYQDLGI